MILCRAFGAVLAALTGLVVFAGPASAHTELVSSSPAEGASLATAPTQIQLTFGEPVTLPPDPVRVVGRDGARWRLGTPSVAGGVVTVPVTPAGGAQAYTLTWKVVAKDGDNVTGSLSFSLTAPASAPATPPTPAAAAPAAVDTTVIPGWVWILVAVAAVLAAGVVLLRVLKGPKR
ncbi:copper resistance CopC family protein [Amycolatopsis vastitatis]|uniref:Copper resistance protein n=1 Tax=Amycolatopsis vastitatis TaxID=1905142 RepID=A0A229T486_9PSEU|nr:copper resistance CopC family protein [Amycolatopsis vastitatis]OXM66022.1 copper resistance protein [Amycolatopsis vastitatis]